MILTQTKMGEIEARLREARAAADFAQTTADAALATPGGDTLPDQAGHGGEFLTTDGAATSWAVPAGGSGNAIYIEEGSAAEGDSSAADLTLDFAGADFDITTAAQTCTISVNDSGIDHDALTNTHNLTTDIDHDALTNFSASEHYAQTAITNVSTGLATGLLKVTTGTGALSVATAGSDYLAPGAIVAKAKTADTTRNNTDVYAADDHLINFSLEASSYYSFIGRMTVTDSGTNDYKVRLVGNQNYTGSGTVQLGTVNAKDVDVSAGTTMTFGQINITSGNAIAHFSGWIYTNTAVSIDVEWAQFFASAANTTLLQGSCFEFHKIQ